MFSLNFKKIFTIFFVFFVLLYFFQLFKVARNYSQSHPFGDENAHMAGGYFILKDYQPYKDFSGNHQPLTYIFPAAVQKLAPANTLYLFVGRHRLSAYFYSIAWQVIYLLILGKFIFFFTLIIEVSRYVLLGNKVLAEVWAMYPLVFLFGIVVKKTIFNKNLKIYEIILFSISTFGVAFSLLPAWPTIVILNLLLLKSYLREKQKILFQFLPFFILTVLLFIFIPFNYYFRDTIIDNITFVIPRLNKIPSNFDYLRMLFLPLSAIRSNPDFINISIMVFIVIYCVIFYLTSKINKIGPFLIIVLALVLTNTRNTYIKFGDFHALPWLAVYFFVPISYLSFFKSNKSYSKRFRKILVPSFLILLTLVFWLNLIHKEDFYGRILFNTKNDLLTEHYINYSRSVKYGLAIKTLKNPKDRLFGTPNDTLVFWVADIDLALPPLESYDWQYQLPRFRKKLYELFKTNPPEFVITEGMIPFGRADKAGLLVEKRLKTDYINLKHLNKPTELYLYKEKVSQVTDKQWKDLEYYLFKKPIVK